MEFRLTPDVIPSHNGAVMSNGNPKIATQKKSSSLDWHPALVGAHLKMRGTSTEQLSRRNGLHPKSLSLALHRPWPKAERIIAKALGVEPQSIWPSRYHSDGTPKSGRGERGIGRHKTKRSTGTRAVNVHAVDREGKREAAAG